MDINTRIPTPAEVAGVTTLTPQQIVEQLRSLRQHVPDFGPLSIPDASSLHKTAHVDAEFAQAAINTIGASTYVTGAIGRTAEEVMLERDDAGRWSAVEDELRTMLQGVSAANLARRHRIGLITLQTYSISRQLVRSKAHSDLLPHVDNMRRLNKFGRKRRTTPDPTTFPE